MNIRNIILASSIAAMTAGTFAYAQIVLPADALPQQITLADADGDETGQWERDGDCGRDHEGRRGDRDHDADNYDDEEISEG